MKKRIAIMQPYYFPYLGYFSLIKNSDAFVFFDTPQYIKKGWINRNRILSCKNEIVYINVPIKRASQATAIKDISICEEENWREKIYGQLTAYKRAPYYKTVMDLIEEVNECSDLSESISKLAINSVLQTCKYLGIDKDFYVFSEMDISNTIKVNEPDEWGLAITSEMGFDSYINSPGGVEFFDRSKYERAGIELKFLKQRLQYYKQRSDKFVEGLSIIDVMMFCSPKEIVDMLDYFDYV